MDLSQTRVRSDPLDDLLRLIKLESHRHRAIVIGEDLGTVPEGFREKLDAAGIAGMRVLWFERDADGFVPPGAWPPRAVVTSAYSNRLCGVIAERKSTLRAL